MTTSNASSRSLAASVAAAFIVVAAGCQPDSDDKPNPGAKPADGRAGSAGAAPRLAQRESIPESGVELGWGWNTRNGEVVPNRCIEFAPVQATGQRVNLSMREVSDKSDVMDSLSVSASVKVNAIFGASGSARASFARESKVSATATSLLLRATIENGVLFAGPRQDSTKPRRAYPSIAADGQPVPPSLAWKQWEEPSEVARDEVVLTKWASELLRKSGQGAFLRHCGNGFVSAIYSGAELLAVTTFSAKNSAEKQNVTAALKSQYGVVELEAAAKAKQQSTLSSTSMEVSYMQVGGGSKTIPTSRDELVKKLQGLATEAAQSPKFNSMEVTGYDTLPSWPTAHIPADDPGPDDTLSDYYWALTSINEDIQSVLDNPKEYLDGAGESLANLRTLQDDINGVRADIYQVALYGRAGPPQKTFSFKSTKLETSLKAPGQVPFSAAWMQNSFVPTLRQQAPLGNVNLLRLKLPLPKSAGAEKATTATAKEVVDYYVGEQSKRICTRNPTDNECLSNAALEKLEKEVTTGKDAYKAPA
jgi:hypothetical protein